MTCWKLFIKKLSDLKKKQYFSRKKQNKQTLSCIVEISYLFDKLWKIKGNCIRKSQQLRKAFVKICPFWQFSEI